MASLFTRIIQGEVPCHKILEDDRFFSFLDIKPLNPGHTLVVPKKEVDAFFDLPDDDIAGISVFAKRVAKAIGRAIPCKKVGVMVAGLEVRHAHMHLVPIMENIHELSFARAKQVSDKELSEVAEKIKRCL